jgi:Leucine-rich repeat (LRR) protein
LGFEGLSSWHLKCKDKYEPAHDLLNILKEFKTKECSIEADDNKEFQEPLEDSALYRMRIVQSNIDHLPNLIFKAFPNLVEFEIQGNLEIAHLQRDSFKGATNLKRLSITGNQNLTRLEDCTFGDLMMLENLNLTSNRIEIISPHTFRGMDHLKELILTENHLKDLNDTIFKNLYNLEDVRLNKNELSQIPSNLFSDNRNIKNLDFSNNKIEIISLFVFQEKPKLSSINFKNNVCVNKTFIIHDYKSDMEILKDELVSCFINHPVDVLVQEKWSSYKNNIHHLANEWQNFILKLGNRILN